MREVDTTNTNTTFKNLHLVNIPIRLGYSHRFNKWLLDIEAGALFNVYVQRNGIITDGSSTFYDLDIDSFNWFRENLDISVQGSIKAGYKFTNNFEIIGGPFISSPLTINENINPVRQTQFTIGFQLSTRYWW